MKKLISALLSLSLLCNSIPANTYYTFAEEGELTNTEEVIDIESTEESEETSESSVTESSEESNDSEDLSEMNENISEESEELSEETSVEEELELSEESSIEEETSASEVEKEEPEVSLEEVVNEPVQEEESSFAPENFMMPSVQPYAISGPNTVVEGNSIQLSGSENSKDCGYSQSWKSSDTDIATVDKNGNVVGVAPGEVTITHTYCSKNNRVHWNHTENTESYTVTVTADSVVRYNIQWMVNGSLSKTTRVKEGEIPAYGGTPEKTVDSTAMEFAGWSTSPNSYDNILSAIPAATQNTTYYAVFTYKAAFYFVLEGKSSTSGEAKDYMYMGTGKVLVHDDYKTDSKKWLNSSHDILGLILEYPTDAAIREGIKAAYPEYSPDWNYDLTYLSYAHISSSVGYDYKLLTNGYSNSFHIDASIVLDRNQTAGILYRATYPDGSVVTNSVTHDKNSRFDLQNTVKNYGSFTTDGKKYDSTINYNGITYTFDGWYSNPAYTQKAPDTLTVTEPRTFYARYIASTRNVAYDANGGAFSDNETSRTGKYEVGRNVTLLKEQPAREGYTFVKWETSDVVQNSNGSFTMPDHDVSFKAKWEIVKRNLVIHYVDEKNNPVASDYIEELEYNTPYNVENPSVLGYTTETASVSGTMGTEVVEITVVYKAKEHSLTVNYLDDKGNTLHQAHTEDVKYNTDYAVESPEIEGYHLVDESQKTVSGTMDDADRTVDVIYALNSHTVTYKVDGAISGKVETVKYGEPLILREVPSKLGYTFSGWSTLPKTMPDQDVVVEGTFTINQYQLLIHYNYEDGTQAKEDVKNTVDYNGTYRVETLPIDGYTPTLKVVEGTMGAGDVEVYVVYKADSHKLTITYKDGNGKTLKAAHEEVLKYNEAYEVESPEIKGYHLVDESQKTVSGTMGDADQNVEVVYALNVHTVTYLVDGKPYGQPDQVEYGKALPAREKPSRTGYTFVGWENLPAAMPDEDVTVSGKFVVNHYKLTTVTDGHADISDAVEYDYSESETTTVSFNAHEGYTITSVFVDGQLADEDVIKSGSVTLDHTSNHTVRVNTTVNQHKITYILDGTLYRTINNVDYGTPLSPLPMDEREGYTFSGWSALPKTMPDQDVVVEGSYTVNSYDLIVHYIYEDNSEAAADHAEKINYNTEYNVSSPVIEGYTADTLAVNGVMKAEKVELTVIYRINRYALTTTYDTHSSISASENYDYSSSETTTVEFSAHEGYTVTKVTVDGKDLSKEEIEAGEVTLDHKSDHTVHVESAVNKYILTYRVDGREAGSEEVEYGTAPKGIKDPVKEGYKFIRWDSMPETMPAEDVVVDAVFEINSYGLRIRYVNKDGVSVYETTEKTVEYGKEYSVDSPSVTGYHLRDDSQKTVSGTMGAEDQTIEVVYDLNVHKVTYLVDGEQYGEIDSVEYGKTPAARPIPQKPGYTFHGWNGLPQTMPDRDVTVTGTFEINQYSLVTSHDAHSSISASTGYEYSETEKTEVTFSAHEGYTVTKVTVDGKDLSKEEIETGKVTLDHKSSHTVDVETTVNSYKLIYMVDGTEYQTFEDVEFGTPVEKAADPSKEGYDFTGWTNLPETMPAHDVTVHAAFAIKSYDLTIQYVYEDDTKAFDDHTEKVEFKKGYEVKSPEKEGYTADILIAKGEMPADNVTVTVKYKINHHNVVYKVDSKDYQIIKDVAFGTELSLIDEPVKEGYTFSGWSTLPETMPDKDVIVSGTFSINHHKVVYEVDGEEYQVFEDIAFGTELSLIDEPVKEGYTFSGWSTLPETMPAGDVLVEGNFTINSYKLTVHYVYEDETKALDDYTANVEFQKTYEVKTSAIEGYTPDIQTVTGKMGAGDTSVTVKYIANRHDITYFVDGVKYDAVEDVAFGTKLSLIDEPVKEGHTFSGWSTLPETMPDKDVIVSGTFSINHHKVVYEIDGEEYQVIKDVAFGTELSLIDEPVKEGYTFSGWSTLPETMPDEDVSVKGTFSINHYNVVYKVDGEEYQVFEDIAFGTKLSLIDEPVKEGYTFSGWSTLPETMPDEAVLVEGRFTINSYSYTVEYYYDEALRNIVQRTAEYGTRVDLEPESNILADDNNYLLVSEDHRIDSISVNPAENVIRVYYELDNAGEKDENGEDIPDGISDKYQVKVHFVAEGGTVSLDDAVVTLYDENGEPSVNGIGHLKENQIPAANPNNGYEGGKWDEVPTVEFDITEEMTFTIRYDRIPDPIEEPQEDPEPIIRVVTPVNPEPEIPDDPEIEIEEPETPLGPDNPEVDPNEDPEITIDDPETPLAKDDPAAWALVNLVLMILTGGASIVLLVGYFLNKKKDEEEEKEETERKKKGGFRLASLIPAAAAVILFFLTENLSNPMVLTDKWTLAMAVIAVVQLVLVVLSKKENETQDKTEA